VYAEAIQLSASPKIVAESPRTAQEMETYASAMAEMLCGT
jgi:hypothetical protein